MPLEDIDERAVAKSPNQTYRRPMEFLAERQNSLDGFRKLFPKFEESGLLKPVQTELILAMSKVLQFASEAYNDPEVHGFQEMTSSDTRIEHLSYESAKSSFEGVLKLKLKNAKDVPKSDTGLWNLSDPYVVFRAGKSVVRSRTVENSHTPVWNSTHYLPLRRRWIHTDFDGKLNVSLFDDDSISGPSIVQFVLSQLNKDDHLGSNSIDLATLKTPGVHSFDLKLKTNNVNTKSPIVSFESEFITFEDACIEMGIKADGPNWANSKSDDSKREQRTDLPWTVEFGQLELEPFAFVENKSTDTQAWLYKNDTAKSLTIAFRGTETDKARDILQDIDIGKERPKQMSKDNLILKPSKELKDRSIRIHSGFLNAYESTREAILQLVVDVTEWEEEWDFCITGHSLGGALATICAFEFSNRRGNGPNPTTVMMNYAAPRVGTAEFCQLYNRTVAASYRVVEDDDIIVTLPPYYMHTASEVICESSGRVLINGKDIESMEPYELIDHRPRTVNSSLPPSKSRARSIVSKYPNRLSTLAKKHLTQNYSSIIAAAASRFFSRNFSTSSRN